MTRCSRLDYNHRIAYRGDCSGQGQKSDAKKRSGFIVGISRVATGLRGARQARRGDRLSRPVRVAIGPATRYASPQCQQFHVGLWCGDIIESVTTTGHRPFAVPGWPNCLGARGQRT